MKPANLTEFGERYAVGFPAREAGWAVGCQTQESGRPGIVIRYQEDIYSHVFSRWEMNESEQIDYNCGRWRLLDVHFNSPEDGWALGVDEDAGGPCIDTD